MTLHTLAVFGRETAHPPALIESEEALKRTHSLPVTDDEKATEEAQCAKLIDAAFNKCQTKTRHKKMLGKGSAYLWESSPYCSYAERNGVHVMFTGEVSEWPGGVNAVDAAHDAFVRNEPPLEENDAHWLLDFYNTFGKPGSTDSTTERALECMAQIKGSFAFVIYDSIHHRVLAARDRDSAQPLFWGCTDAGQLMFGSVAEDLDGCNPTAAPFPAGTLFASERHTVAYSPGEYGWVIVDDDVPGLLMSFLHTGKDNTSWRGVKAIPRVTSKGVVTGAVYKVASAQNMEGVC
ncbi:hypothetical protein HYH03_000189 [Edaphochlamys debaryana]|uniref:DUF3700 domain-containing protein n=1 Tax=Edaphochlamys debaryana TaxID=47281 RepID=A0A836C7E4_9CHLO|nr:hypothetical protein HYH03_000189 [Edaphochlamys debaryana]|eukprot:KAG2501687.1 hypothetical protein HYH03_000189 [Edaphochlamys debaryana]